MESRSISEVRRPYTNTGIKPLRQPIRSHASTNAIFYQAIIRFSASKFITAAIPKKGDSAIVCSLRFYYPLTAAHEPLKPLLRIIIGDTSAVGRATQ